MNRFACYANISPACPPSGMNLLLCKCLAEGMRVRPKSFPGRCSSSPTSLMSMRKTITSITPSAKDSGISSAPEVPSARAASRGLESSHPALAPRSNSSPDTSRRPINGPLSQATIDGQPYQVNENTPPEIRQFLSQSLSNTRYDSVKQLQRRAEVYLKYIEAEKTLIKDAAVALQDPASPLVQQSGWMIHLERALWNSESAREHMDRLQLDRQQLGDKVLETGTVLEGTPYFREGRRKLSPSARSVFGMVLKGKAGPLTAEQSTTGYDVAQEGQLVAGRLNIAARKACRDANRHAASRSQTHVRTVGGLDLSRDAGTRVRDELGVPVMTGTSGSSSDVALATKFGAQQAQASWAAPGLTEEEAKTAMTDLALHFFRTKTTSTSTSPPVLLAEDMNLARFDLGLPAKEVEVAQVFTHSYAEVHSGTSLTIDGVDPHNPQAVEQALVDATRKAKERLDEVKERLDAVVGARET